jgi:prophage maintenance system killer protein
MENIEYLSEKLILAIHDNLPPEALGFMSKTNFDFLMETVENFPENIGIPVKSRDEKIVWVSSYYLFHLVSSHPFNDGNKRTAFLTLTTFLISNGLLSNYNEEKVSSCLDKINSFVAKGSRPKVAIKLFEEELHDTPEYSLINLLFDLAASEGERVYSSPKEIFGIVNKFIFKFENGKPLPCKKTFFNNFINSIVGKKDK